MIKLVKCYTKKCKKERDLWLKNSNKLNNDYKDGKITKEQFKEKIKILDKNHISLIGIEYINLSLNTFSYFFINSSLLILVILDSGIVRKAFIIYLNNNI